MNLAEIMIESTLAAQKVDQTLALLERIQELIPFELNYSSQIWDRLSSGISNGVSLHQMTLKLSPHASHHQLHGSPPPRVCKGSDRTRAGNIARNIYCHAFSDRMDDWQSWHASLEPDFRSELDEFWYDNSGWAIGLPTTRTRRDVPLDQRLAIMKNILSQREIVGSRGALHDKPLQRLRKSGYFSAAEFIQIKDELAEVIPD